MPFLKNNGYCVFALTYGARPGLPWPFTAIGGMTDMNISAQQLGAFIDKVLAATGARQVDIVGHSQGAMIPTLYAKYLGGAKKIDHYVSLAPNWHGTSALGADAILVVQNGCPIDHTEHAGLVGSKRAAFFVLNALDPANPRPARCLPAAPFTGSA